MKKCVIITTINRPTESVFKYIDTDYDVIIVGDLKTKDEEYIILESQGKVVYLSVEKQKEMFPRLSELLPYNHYCRKNIGHAFAITSGYDVIADTDDDNIPCSTWGDYTQYDTTKCITNPKKVNIFSYYTNEKIWPRGFDIKEITKEQNIETEENNTEVFVWQGLVNGDPDVDAIYRLTQDKRIFFEEKKQIVLDKNVFTQSNTQNTLWVDKKVHIATYIPATVTFRFCDILRGYVAQKIIWNNGGRMGYNHATVYQERNAHDYMRDFQSEVPMYENIDKLIHILYRSESLTLIEIYNELVQHGIVQEKELEILAEWEKICNRPYK
jgi:hypothetical protein